MIVHEWITAFAKGCRKELPFLTIKLLNVTISKLSEKKSSKLLRARRLA
jgi:type VI protein secretion system component Hcp